MQYFRRRSENIPDLYMLARELNIKRTYVAACFVIVFQIIDRCFRLAGPVSWIRYHSYALIILSVLYLCFAHIFRYANMNRDTDIAYISCKLYWLLFTVIMGGYYIADIVYTGVPLNMLITGALFLIVPVYISLTNIAFFSAFTVYNVAICLIMRAGVQYTFAVAFLSLACLGLSVFMQQQFLDTILLLRKENRVDFLTNTLNRRGGIEKMIAILELCKRHQRSAAVFMADIDNFKIYNDTFGHLKGDGALKAVAEALGSVFTRTSDAVCRYGGEEFLVCSSVKSSTDVDMLAGKALAAVRGKEIAFGETTLSVSIGYTLYSPDADPFSVHEYTLIEEADSALYAAKQAGKDRAARFEKPGSEQGGEQP